MGCLEGHGCSVNVVEFVSVALLRRNDEQFVNLESDLIFD